MNITVACSQTFPTRQRRDDIDLDAKIQKLPLFRPFNQSCI